MKLGKPHHGRDMSLIGRLLVKHRGALPVGAGSDPLFVDGTHLVQRIGMSGTGRHGETPECFPLVLRRSLPFKETFSQKIQCPWESGLRRLFKLEKGLMLVLLHAFSI